MDKISTSSSEVSFDKSKGSSVILLRFADLSSSKWSFSRGRFCDSFSANAERAWLPANVSRAGFRPGKGRKGVAAAKKGEGP